MRICGLFVLILGCSSAGTGITVPADRPLLSWTGTSAVDANRALLPKTFTAPDVHACAADPSRRYLGELFTEGIDHPQVLWHWAPIVSGPQAATPTLSQPEFSLAGTLAQVDDSGDDVLADHPFGVDVDADVSPDPDFAFLPFEQVRSTFLHTEIEVRTLPRASLGYSPRTGDRALMRGVWVLDCGHPPYGAEMHPPTFVSYARALDDHTTISTALVAPVRSSLLFHGDPALATALNNTARFAQGKPFPVAMVSGVEEAIFSGAERLTTHAMMIPNRFDPIDFLVCAPLPRPAGATLQASWRFTARKGVQVKATPIDSAGCVRFEASMDASYLPKPLTFATEEWSWQQLSDSASGQIGASIDVRQEIIDELKSQGIDGSAAPALQVDHPPLIDAYAALQTLSGADQDSPSQIQASDDQPFPFYGRARVAWSR